MGSSRNIEPNGSAKVIEQPKPINSKNWKEFEGEIDHLINRLGIDNDMNIPDYIIAEHIMKCLLDLRDTYMRISKYYKKDV